jgi:SPP1 family predicted phage head-tail adaptor
MSLAAGRLRWRMTLQKQVQAQDPDTLEITHIWANVDTDIPSEIAALSAREWIAAGARQAEVTSKITMRYRSDVKADMRLVDQATGDVYSIAGAIPGGRSGREWLTLPASLGPTDGS